MYLVGKKGELCREEQPVEWGFLGFRASKHVRVAARRGGTSREPGVLEE